MFRCYQFTRVLLVAVLLAGCSASRSTSPTDGELKSQTAASTSEAKADSAFKDYDKVITKHALSDEGLFTVHTIGEKLYYEIPDSLMRRDMLLVSRIAQTPANLSGFINAGSKTAEQVIRWERREKNVLLRKRSFSSVAADSLPVSISVSQNNFEPIIASFDIEALGNDTASVVIEVTAFFSGDVPAISGLSTTQRTNFKVRRLDPDRSFIDYARSFPLNVDVRHTMTFEAAEPPSNTQTGTISMQMHQSMILLPEKPMMPRLADPRVGFFSITQIDFGLDELKAGNVQYIRRWRLEPSDPEAYARGELVEPVKPIVYYLDPATPEKWRPFFRRGIEDWNVVFESAGFKNAIRARNAPTPEEDPEFSPEDVRYSTVRYVANTTRNAVGPSVSDPRSGEIIESDIVWYHNHMRSYRNRLMIETGAANPNARSLKIGDELIGETMRRVITHEIGHAIGLPHNMLASSAYPVDSLRSPTFTSQFGVAPTIMDYARQNYIAQPGDGVEQFVRKIGPYDHYSIEWGYRYYGLSSPTAEKPILDRLILDHAGDPVYAYAPQTVSFDPRKQTEDMGDDPIRASTLAVANLKRVVPNLIEWTSTAGRDYSDLDELYGELLGQWNRYMGHVATIIGGVHESLKASDQDGVVFEIVSREQQQAALTFLQEQVFTTPVWLHDPEILRRIEPAGAVDRIRQYQVSRLNSLLSPSRLQRMIEASVIDPERAYPMHDFVGDLQDGIWSELRRSQPIDTYRRNLQRGYLERMESLLVGNGDVPRGSFFGPSIDVSQSDIGAVVRSELTQLQSDAARASRRSGDEMTRIHLADVVARITAILDDERDQGDH